MQKLVVTLERGFNGSVLYLADRIQVIGFALPLTSRAIASLNPIL